MQSNCIKNLLDLKGVIVKKVKNSEKCVEIFIELPVLEHICPCCGSKTSKIHDYYTQPIKDLPIQFKPTKIIYKKRRYECKNCGKNFFENNDVIKKYARRTTQFTAYVVNELRNLVACSDISKRTTISPSIISKLYIIQSFFAETLNIYLFLLSISIVDIFLSILLVFLLFIVLYSTRILFFILFIICAQ